MYRVRGDYFGLAYESKIVYEDSFLDGYLQ